MNHYKKKRRQQKRKKKHNGFPSGWSDITRMFNLKYQGRLTTQTNTQSSGDKRVSKKERGGLGRENVINHTTVCGSGGGVLEFWGFLSVSRERLVEQECCVRVVN